MTTTDPKCICSHDAKGGRQLSLQCPVHGDPPYVDEEGDYEVTDEQIDSIIERRLERERLLRERDDEALREMEEDD